MSRVVITGMGVMSAIGTSVAAYGASLQAGQSGIGPITSVPPDRISQPVAAEIQGFEATEHFGSDQLPLLDRFSQIGLVAAREAVADAGLELTEEESYSTACVIGTGGGGLQTIEEGYRRIYEENKKRVFPFMVPKFMGNACTSHVSMEFGLRGPAFSVSSACATATHSIGLGYQMVKNGSSDVAVVGGTDAFLNIGSIKAWEALRVMSKDTCRPFCKDRSGMVLGEGAGIFVLESLERAQARGATIHAEIVGFGMSADAGDLLAPSAEGAARAVKSALKDAGLAPNQIQYVNAHGTGTAANDVTETQCLHQVFGAHAKSLMVSSTKSFHGHSLGSSGAVELVAAVMAVRDGFVAPTINFTEADPECDLDYVPNEGRQTTVDAAISNSFAFGGLNAVLALKRFAG
ncbi:MAG: beta-ketoacyl-[acyl-carrier-protein] synthase family protein [Rhodospirillaceae bacterium]